MAYADYEYYKSSYYGVLIKDTEFQPLAERASDYIAYITRGRAPADNAPAAVKKACCALAEVYQGIARAQAAAASDNGELASQTVGSWSATYRSGAETARESEAQLYRVAQRYLANTGLLYRGGTCACTLPTL